MTTTLNYRKAIAESIARVMRDDGTVMLLGEDVGAAGGAFKSTVGLFEEFGPRAFGTLRLLSKQSSGLRWGRP